MHLVACGPVDLERLEDAQRLDDGEAPGAGQGHGDEAVAAVVALEGLSPPGLVPLEIRAGEDPAQPLHRVDHRPSHRARVERWRAARGEEPQGAGELGLGTPSFPGRRKMRLASGFFLRHASRRLARSTYFGVTTKPRSATRIAGARIRARGSLPYLAWSSR